VIALVLDALAAYRLTRLATADTLLNVPRAQVVRWAYVGSAPYSVPPEVVDAGGWVAFAMDDGEAPKLATLVTCRFCAGMWVSLAVVAARRLFPRAWPPMAKALAFSAGAALLAGLED
jgi:hypothetical protein